MTDELIMRRMLKMHYGRLMCVQRLLKENGACLFIRRQMLSVQGIL